MFIRIDGASKFPSSLSNHPYIGPMGFIHDLHDQRIGKLYWNIYIWPLHRFYLLGLSYHHRRSIALDELGVVAGVLVLYGGRRMGFRVLENITILVLDQFWVKLRIFIIWPWILPIGVNVGLSIEALLSLGLVKVFIRMVVRFFINLSLILPSRTIRGVRFSLFFEGKILHLINFVDQTILSGEMYLLIVFSLKTFFAMLSCCRGHCNAIRNRPI